MENGTRVGRKNIRRVGRIEEGKGNEILKR